MKTKASLLLISTAISAVISVEAHAAMLAYCNDPPKTPYICCPKLTNNVGWLLGNACNPGAATYCAPGGPLYNPNGAPYITIDTDCAQRNGSPVIYPYYKPKTK